MIIECKIRIDLNKLYCRLNPISSNKVMIHLVKVCKMKFNLNNSDKIMMKTQMQGILCKKIYCRMKLKMKNAWDRVAKNLDIFLEANNVSNV